MSLREMSLATMACRPFLFIFSNALAARSEPSAAKPTLNTFCASFSLPSAATRSGICSRSTVSRDVSSRRILWSATRAGRKSATAAAITSTSAPAISRLSSSSISSAVSTGRTSMPRCGGCDAVVTSVTRAPRSAAATASASDFISAAAPARRPVPTCPLARCPDSGSTTAKPLALSAARFSCTADFDHMASFIAGATTTGPRDASSVAVTMSSDSPLATRLMMFAVAGARSVTCAQSPRNTCGSAGPSAAHRPVSTGLPQTSWKEAAPTNRAADAVIATLTCAPAWVSAEARSTILYAAIPPATSKAMRRPFSSSGTSAWSSGMGLSLALTRSANDRQHLPYGTLEVVVNHDVVEVGCDGHLGLRNALPRRTILGVLAVPLRPAPQELVHGGWRQEDSQRIRRSLAHLFGALDVDLEDDVVAGRALLVELRERSAVQVAAVGRVFEEGTLADQPLELLPRYEVVVDGIDLARPGPAGRVGDRVSKVGIDLEQALDDRVLADARRTRDDDQETSTRMALVPHAPLPHPLPCGERGSTDAQNA